MARIVAHDEDDVARAAGVESHDARDVDTETAVSGTCHVADSLQLPQSTRPVASDRSGTRG